jgi:hypothetical protein
MRRSFVALAVALPLVALVLGIVRSERHLAEGRRWTFEITGYDPRDLLRGHYIQFRLVLDDTDLPVDGAANGTPCEDDAGDKCCLCLFPGLEGEASVFEHTTCEVAREQCEGALPLRYLAGLRRYYIAEERAEELTRIFQDASQDALQNAAQDTAQDHRTHLVVAVDATGKPQIDKLLIDGTPVEQAQPPPVAQAPVEEESAGSNEVAPEPAARNDASPERAKQDGGAPAAPSSND